MNKKSDVFTMMIWRLGLLIVAAIWLAAYLFTFYPIGTYASEYVIIDPVRFYIPIILIGIMLLCMIFFPYKFQLHGAFCWFFGLLLLIDGGLIVSLSIHLFGYAFLYRHGFFNTNKKIKLFVGGLIIAAAIASQARIPAIDILARLFYFAAFFSILISAIVIMQPEIQLIRKKRREKILVLPSNFTESDAEVLRKILANIKYEVLAKEKNMSLSKFKRYTKQMYNSIKLNDHMDFMIRYKDHKIIIEEIDPPPSDKENLNNL